MKISEETVQALRDAVEVSRSLLNYADVDPPASVLVQIACELLSQERFRAEGARFAKLEKALESLVLEVRGVSSEVYKLELNPEFHIDGRTVS